jgi:type IV secretory pathway TraG/TraD family ATPase VirD4
MHPVALTAVLTVTVALGVRLLTRGVHQHSRESHKRGVLIADGAPMQRRSARRKRTRSELLTLAGVGISPSDECKHFKLIGTTGTGKTTAIRELLGAAIARGDRAVFADPDAGYLQHFYNRYRGDIVLNPFEAQSVKWNLFAEVEDSFDVDQLANGLIPDCDDASAREWRGYARTFLAAIIRRCRFSGAANAGDLWRLLMVASAEELRPVVEGTPAQPFLDTENARMFGSIRSVAGSAMAAYEYVQKQRATLFSVRQWVKNRTHTGMLFIPYRAGQIAALRSIIATWMHLAIFEALSQPEGRDQRLWFVVDELDALGAVHGLKDALARLRKFGGRCVLGFQSASQVSATYGGDSQALVENCGNSLILRCSSSENGGTSQFASRLIGEREVLRRQLSRGKDRESALLSRSVRRSRSITDHHVIETAVLASELEQLPDLCGYLKTASSATWWKVKLTRH